MFDPSLILFLETNWFFISRESLVSSVDRSKTIFDSIGSLNYSSNPDVAWDALRTFMGSKKDLRLAAAVELYKREEISLGKAAEMADTGVVEFKERLAELGIIREIKSETAKKMDTELARIRRRYDNRGSE